MKVIVAGSRSIKNKYLVFKAIEESQFNITEEVSGKARGVDTLGEEYAKSKGIKIKEFPADWDRYGKKAGPMRNEEMAKYADAVIIIWDGISTGTMDMARRMQKYKKPIKAFKVINNNVLEKMN